MTDFTDQRVAEEVGQHFRDVVDHGRHAEDGGRASVVLSGSEAGQTEEEEEEKEKEEKKRKRNQRSFHRESPPFRRRRRLGGQPAGARRGR